MSIRTILLFFTKVFINTASTAQEELGFLVVAARKAFLEENSEARNQDTMKGKLGNILLFLWVVGQNQIVPLVHALFKKREIMN